jgi:hypothetical protein
MDVAAVHVSLRRCMDAGAWTRSVYRPAYMDAGRPIDHQRNQDAGTRTLVDHQRNQAQHPGPGRLGRCLQDEPGQAGGGDAAGRRRRTHTRRARAAPSATRSPTLCQPEGRVRGGHAHARRAHSDAAHSLVRGVKCGPPHTGLFRRRRGFRLAAARQPPPALVQAGLCCTDT